MSSNVTCSCGEVFRVPDKLVGKRVKCPGCGRVVTHSGVTGGTPSLRPADGRCPRCGSAVGPDAKLCVQCGTDLRTGQRVKVREARPTAPHDREGGRGAASVRFQSQWLPKVISVLVLVVLIGGGMLWWRSGSFRTDSKYLLSAKRVRSLGYMVSRLAGSSSGRPGRISHSRSTMRSEEDAVFVALRLKNLPPEAVEQDGDIAMSESFLRAGKEKYVFSMSRSEITTSTTGTQGRTANYRLAASVPKSVRKMKLHLRGFPPISFRAERRIRDKLEAAD